MQTKTTKTYTDIEAAEKLGISTEQLYALVRRYISNGEKSGRLSGFKASDLVVLSILASNATVMPVAAVA